MPELITILGPTATGKTRLAALLADRIGGEVISADSRQVYRGMDLGTGKDLDDYLVERKIIPYHLIDIAAPGEEYNVFRYQGDFISVYQDITARKRRAIMCGGTGMYLESVIRAYDMKTAPRNEKLRKELEILTDKALIEKLESTGKLHNITDTLDRERTIRALEIYDMQHANLDIQGELQALEHKVFGVLLDRAEIRRRITERLKRRLDEGMIEEVKGLLESGVKARQLEFYGLEYRYLTQFVTGNISYNDMFQRLNSAIHQFAKRQMTWFRRMERQGVHIRWIDGSVPDAERLSQIMKKL